MCFRGSLPHSLTLLTAVAALVATSHAVAEPKNVPALNKNKSAAHISLQPAPHPALQPVAVALTDNPSSATLAPTSAAHSPPAVEHEIKHETNHQNKLRLPRFISGLFDTKPKRNEGSVELPLGMSYSREANGLMLPLDEKKTWGIGFGMDLNNRAGTPDTPVNGVIIDYRPAPGAVLQGRF